MQQNSRWLIPGGCVSLMLIAVLPFLSGAAALSHELLWTRRLVDLLGATDWVIGRVLGLFFLGLSIGGYLASLTKSSKRPAIVKLAIAELLVAVFALPAAFLPAWTDWIWAAIGTEDLVSWYGASIKLLLAAIVVLPPAIAMGFTMPFFVKSATDLGGKLASAGICVYALNTLGGVFGLWITSTYLVQWLGAQSTMLAVALSNGCIALAIFGIHRTSPRGAAEIQPKKKDKAAKRAAPQLDANNKAVQPLSQWQLLVLSFMSGLIVLSLEVLLLRLIALVVPSSYHTTSALLANVILILAIGSGLISLFNWVTKARSQAIITWTLICALAGAAILIGLCPKYLFDQTDKMLSLRYFQALNDSTIDSVNHFWILVFWLVASIGGLALLCAGLVFPSILSLSSTSDPSGDRIGILLAVNGIGGLLGSELTNSILIGYVGIYQGCVVLAVVAMLTTVALLIKTNLPLSIVAAIGLSIIIFVGHRYSADQPYLSPRTTKKYEVQSTHFGREGVLLVVEDGTKSKSILVNNQYVLGSSGVTAVQRRQLILPWIIKPEAESVCCLGLATGISASGLEVLEEPPAITSVELSANVEKIARRYFQDETQGLFNRAENRVVVEDARTFMAAANNEYDLIVGDLFRPYGTGEGRLYSVEHFENVRKALTDKGLFCQWLPIYQLNRENFEIIAATFQKVFPETLVIYANIDSSNPVLGLVATKDNRKWQKQLLSRRFDSIPESLTEVDIALTAAKALVVGVLKEETMSEVEVNTLDNLRIEISAGNFWILKDLRKNRPVEFETELLKGNQLVRFNQYLEEITDPVLPKEYRMQYKNTLRAKMSRSK